MRREGIADEANASSFEFKYVRRRSVHHRNADQNKEEASFHILADSICSGTSDLDENQFADG